MKSFILSLILLFGCAQKTYIPSEKQKLANEVRKKAAEETARKTGLRPCGTMGQMLDEIEKLGVSYFNYQEIDIDGARKLLVTAVNDLVNAVNENEEIQPYLANYPFTSNNVEMTIAIKNPDASEVLEGKLCLIGIRNDRIYYDIEDSTGHLKKIFEETFESAILHLNETADPVKL